MPVFRLMPLLGGYAGAASPGRDRGTRAQGLNPDLSFIVISPLIGLLLGSCMTVSVQLVLQPLGRRFVWTGSSAGCSSSRRPSTALATAHDAQKTMGIITGIPRRLRAPQRFEIPALGDLRLLRGHRPGDMFGGWRCQDDGDKITKLQPSAASAPKRPEDRDPVRPP